MSELAWLTASGAQYTDDCVSLGVSRDSRYVHFDCGGGSAAYDLETGEQRSAEGIAFGPTVDASGTLEVFASWDPLIPEDTNNAEDVYVRNRIDGTLSRASVRSDGGESAGGSSTPTISADGRLVAFVSAANDLTNDANNDVWDIFLHDRTSGETARVSLAYDGTDGSSFVNAQRFSSGGIGVHRSPRISANGRFVIFSSTSIDLVSGEVDEEQWSVYFVNMGSWVDSLPAE